MKHYVGGRYVGVMIILLEWCVSSWAAAQVDDGLSDDFFDEPFDTDTTLPDSDEMDTDVTDPATDHPEITADHAVDDGFDGMDSDAFAEDDTDTAEVPDPNMPCKTFRSDYVDILSENEDWPSPGDRTYPFIWVRWENDGKLTDAYSQCCWLNEESAPRCIRRVQIDKTGDSIGQTALDASTLYEYFLPFHEEAVTENYRHQFSVRLRANVSNNPLRRNGLWGIDMDVTGSMLGRSEQSMNKEPSYLHVGSLAAFGAWRWMPGVRNRKAGKELIGRHFLGINVTGGLIRQSTYYTQTFDDMPIYRFYGRPIPYRTSAAFRNYQPFSAGWLEKAGMEGRTRLGASLESNNFFTLPIEVAHAFGLDANARVDLFAASLAARDQLTPLDYPIFVRYTARANEAATGGLVVSPKINVGGLTKVDTIRLHLGYNGEYTIQPRDIISEEGHFESRYRRNTAFLSLAIHFLDLNVSYTSYKESQAVFAETNDWDSPTYRSRLFHTYLAFHLFQLLAKRNQHLDRYRHAVNAYAEYLSHRSTDSAEVTFQRDRSNSTHALAMGLFSAFPLYPTRGTLTSRPHGVELDFIGDISTGVIQREWSMSFIAGLRIAPY